MISVKIEKLPAVFEPARPILQRIEQAGYEAYFVGGCVRDTILGDPIHDIDIATSAYPAEIKQIFNRTVDTGIEHGTVMILDHGVGYETTTFRTESGYQDFRRPDSVTFVRSLAEDLKRRDFTINALALKENGEVNFEMLDTLLEVQIAGGTDAIIICGTTGESACLTEEEHLEVIKHCVETVNHRIPVVAGAGSNATATAVMLSKHAEADGADGLLSVTPYYNKGTQDGMVRHFTAVSEAVNIPVIVYNVPSRTGSNISAESMGRLVKETKNVRGIKDATGDLAYAAMTMLACGEELDYYAGNDDIIVPTMALGGLGVISVLSNIAPKQTHDICQACLDGDFKKGAKLQLEAMALIKALFIEVNPIPVKKALEYLGYKSTSLRLPLTDMTEANAAKLKKEMEAYGLL